MSNQCVLPISGKDEEDLRRIIAVLKEYLESHEVNLNDFCFSVASERNPRENRLVFEARSCKALIAAMGSYLDGNPVPPVLDGPARESVEAFLGGFRPSWRSVFGYEARRCEIPDLGRQRAKNWAGVVSSEMRVPELHALSWELVEVSVDEPLLCAVAVGTPRFHMPPNILADRRCLHEPGSSWKPIVDILASQGESLLVGFDQEIGAEALLNDVFSLVRSLQDSALGIVDLTVVLQSTGQVDAGFAAAAALLRVAQTENPGWRVRVIETDAIGIAVPHTSYTTAGYSRLKVERGRVLRQVLGAIPIPAGEECVIGNGAYLVTGATGGIGQELVRYLAGFAGVTIALVARRAMDLDDSGNPVGLASAVRFARASGAEVLGYRADVCDRNAMKAVLADLRRRGHAIKGVFHAAGVAGDGFLARKSREEFSAGISAKITGARYLHELTLEDPVEHFVLFSSIASLLAPPGQGDYVAGNAYLDALAEARTAVGLPAISVNWSAWRETGMAVRYGVNHDTIFRSLPTSQAITALDLLLRHGSPSNVIVGDLNTNSRMVFLLEAMPFALSPELVRRIQRTKREFAELDAGSMVQARLSAAVKAVLGVAAPDPDVSFLEFTGDSLALSQLRAHIEKEYGYRVSIADLFAHPSIAQLAQHLERVDTAVSPNPPEIPQGGSAVEPQDVAVIGMAVCLPGATTLSEFLMLLRDGRVAIDDFPERRHQDADAYLDYMGNPARTYLRAGHLEAVDEFDHIRFRITPRDADLMDPHHRIFLDVATQAVENAGYALSSLEKTSTGVFVGASLPVKGNYGAMVFDTSPEMFNHSLSANIASAIPARFAFTHNCHGPVVSIDTACSSSLVAVFTALRSLQLRECNLAIAGGVRLNLLPVADAFSLGIESPSSELRAFDASADGTVSGEGCSVVVLKRLKDAISDGDAIHAVLRGGAINHDGSTASLTAPNANSQREVLLRAWADANVDPSTLSFIEAHGTGTSLGDLIELQAATQAFREHTQRRQFCSVGTVKSNIGHLYEAAGVTGLVKAVLMVSRHELYKSCGYMSPNPEQDLTDSPFVVQSELEEWRAMPDGPPMVGGVSAFGLSGTNCHVVIQEAPSRLRLATSRKEWPIVLSNHSKEQVETDLATLLAYVESGFVEDADLPALAYTLCCGRDSLPVRRGVVVHDLGELLEKLRNPSVSAGWMFGEVRVVTSEETEPLDGSITRAESFKLGETADDAIASDDLQGVIAAFIAGGQPRWDLWFEDTCQRLHLPPLSRHPVRHWLTMNGACPQIGSRWLKRQAQVEADPERREQLERLSVELAKVEREFSAGKAAPETMAFRLRADGRDPSDLEWELASIWQTFLGFEEVRLDDNFFALGGDSIKALQIANRLNELGYQVATADLMQFQTLEALAIHLSPNDISHVLSAEQETELRIALEDPEANCAVASITIKNMPVEELETTLWQAYGETPELHWTISEVDARLVRSSCSRIRDDIVIEDAGAGDDPVAQRLEAWRGYVAHDLGLETGEWFRFILFPTDDQVHLVMYYSTLIIASDEAEGFLQLVEAMLKARHALEEEGIMNSEERDLINQLFTSPKDSLTSRPS